MRYVILIVAYSVLIPMTAKSAGDWLTQYGIKADEAAYDAWLSREQERMNGHN